MLFRSSMYYMYYIYTLLLPFVDNIFSVYVALRLGTYMLGKCNTSTQSIYSK